MIKYLIWRDNHPHGQDLERKEAGEEENDDGTKHDDDLSPTPRHRGWLRSLALTTSLPNS